MRQFGPLAPSNQIHRELTSRLRGFAVQIPAMKYTYEQLAAFDGRGRGGGEEHIEQRRREGAKERTVSPDEAVLSSWTFQLNSSQVCLASSRLRCSNSRYEIRLRTTHRVGRAWTRRW